MAKSIQELKKTAAEKIMNVLMPGAVSNRVEGELFTEILSIIESVIGTTGTIFQGVITTTSSGPIAGLTGNLAYLSTQSSAGTYIYSKYGGVQVTVANSEAPAIILISRVNNVWGATVLPVNMSKHQFRDAYFAVTAKKGMTIQVHSGGYPENAYIVLRRKKKCPKLGRLSKRGNDRKWCFVGNGQNGGDIISDLSCFQLPIPRDPGVYTIDLTPYLPFIKREYLRGALQSVHMTGNKYTYKILNNGDRLFRRLYNDIAIQIAYRTETQNSRLNERWRFGEMVRLRYVAELCDKDMNGEFYTRISESIVVK